MGRWHMPKQLEGLGSLSDGLNVEVTAKIANANIIVQHKR